MVVVLPQSAESPTGRASISRHQLDALPLRSASKHPGSGSTACQVPQPHLLISQACLQIVHAVVHGQGNVQIPQAPEAYLHDLA